MQEGGFWETNFRLAWSTRHKATIVTIPAEGLLNQIGVLLAMKEGAMLLGKVIQSVCGPGEVHIKVEYNSTA